MGRILLSICALVVALGLAALQRPDSSSGNDQSQPSQEAQTPPPIIPEPQIRSDPEDPGCEPDREDRESDLCAQWKAADAAQSSANAAWTLGIVGLAIGAFTLGAAVCAAAFAKRAAVASEGSLLNDHRPRIAVRRVRVEDCDGGLKGSFRATSVGGSDAVFYAAGCWVYSTKRPLPSVPPYEGQYDVFAGDLLPLEEQPARVGPRGTAMTPGDWVPFHFLARDVKVRRRGYKIYVMGWVDYRRKTGNHRHRAAFCREYVPDESRFVAVENPDYEYED